MLSPSPLFNLFIINLSLLYKYKVLFNLFKHQLLFTINLIKYLQRKEGCEAN
jgi:hypothetical protein